jgi:predicted hydrocarbon binding protein
MPKYGMDVRVIGLLISSDYSTFPSDEYTTLQTSIGRKCSKIIYTALSVEGFKVNFTDTIYAITNELIRIAAHIMFGSELQFSNVQYRDEKNLCSLTIGIKKCPICEYIESKDPVCHLLSGFFGRLIELSFSRFANIIVDCRENSCIACGDSHCDFTVKWRVPRGLPSPKKEDVEIRIDEEALKEKVAELENLDFYKRIVEFARTRRGVSAS